MSGDNLGTLLRRIFRLTARVREFISRPRRAEADGSVTWTHLTNNVLRIKINTSPAVSAAIIFAGLLLAYVYRATFPIYAIIFFSLFLSGLLFARSIKRAGWVVHNLAFVFLALAMAELYFEYKNEFDAFDGATLYPHVIRSQDSLGYEARAGTFRAVRTYGFGTRVVYDVQYSIDKNGLRIAPDSLKQNGPTVMFFEIGRAHV